MSAAVSRPVQQLATAREISAWLECAPRYARKLLKNVPPSGSKIPTRLSKQGKEIVTGTAADAWTFESLPYPLQRKLESTAERKGFRNALQMLRERPAKVSINRSLAGISKAAVEHAARLRRVFAGCLALPSETSITDRIRVAAPEFGREFGRTVGDRQLRSLIARALERDGGRRNFDDLRIYLPQRPGKRITKSAPSATVFPELDRAFSEIIKDVSRVTIAEIDNCWREILAFFNDKIAAGGSEKKLKRHLITYIVLSAPFLGATPQAVKRNLNRKLREMIDCGGIDQVRDGRLNPPKRSEDKAKRFETDVQLCIKHAAFYCGRRESQAYRQLYMGTTHNGDRFSEEFRAVMSFDPRNRKSEMPRWMRRVVTPAVEALKPHVLGPRAVRNARPSIHRDWSNTAAGDFYTSDDQTLNRDVIHYCEWGDFEDPSGRRFNIGQPQFLPVVDERTDFPLSFSLIPAKAYNSWHIRTLFSRACMRREIGLPFRGFVVELGIWAARNVEALVEWSRIDHGFSRYGLTIRHATRPKAKTIERVIGAFQNLDEWAPGYAGRNRQITKYERVEQFRLQLKRVDQPRKAAVDPREMFMTIEECEETLLQVMQRFADEPQNGDRLQGLSPSEAWAQLSGGRAHLVLPESLRYLLGTAESVQTVTSEGIVLRIGRLKHYYAGSDRLGTLIGEKVRVRYNPELPEQITVAHIASDPRGLNPFSVPLFERVPAHGATSVQFSEAREHQNRFASYGRALYRELAPQTNTTICDSKIGSPELRAAGEAHNRLEREHIELNESRDRERSSIVRLAASQNRAVDPRKVRNPERVKKHLESAARKRQQIVEIEKEPAIAQKEEDI